MENEVFQYTNDILLYVGVGFIIGLFTGIIFGAMSWNDHERSKS